MKNLTLEFIDIEDDMSDFEIEEVYYPHAIFTKAGISFTFDEIVFNKLTSVFSFLFKNNFIATYETHDDVEIYDIKHFADFYNLHNHINIFD